MATKPPLALFLLILLFGMGLVLLLQMRLQQDLYFIAKIAFGLDYHSIYRASGVILDGGSPYQPPLPHLYAMPPLPAILNIPLTQLHRFRASEIIAYLSYVAVVVSLLLAYRAMTPRHESRRGDNAAMAVIFMLIPMFSYPFFFLFDRGQMDGFTLLLMSIGVYLLAGQSTARQLLAGGFIAAAIAFKLYPILLLLPLLAMRRYLALGALAATLLCLILISPELYLHWLEQTLNTRVGWFRTTENGSLANTLGYIGELLGFGYQLRGVAYELWGVLFLAMFYVDFGRMSPPPQSCPDNRRALAGVLFYTPFMVAVPGLAYHYELVCVLILLPVLSYLWAGAGRGEKRLLLCITVGLALSQFQAVAVYDLLAEKEFPHWMMGACRQYGPHSGGGCLPHWIPGFGLFVVMLGCVSHKACYLYRPRR